jgi:hypothetical protein
MNIEKPTPSVPETFKPPTGRDYRVTSKDSWVSLAGALKIGPWDLIDFNFPGMKSAMQINAELASRQVNWYLSEYLGCRVSRDGRNLAFSEGLSAGRGVHKGGVIFLPPVAPPPSPPPHPSAPPGCSGIEITAKDIAPRLSRVLTLLNAIPPVYARCLDPIEVTYAQSVYGASLAYDDIYISAVAGLSDRPFTTAIKLGGVRWVVVLNVGPGLFSRPNSDKSTLIHELAHAWQSQHHSDPEQYMINCVESQALAAAITVQANAAYKAGAAILGVPNIDIGPASAYAYVPGQAFGQYGGEQIAQQVEDYNFPPLLKAPPYSMNASVKAQLGSIVTYMNSRPPGVVDAGNVLGLSATHVGLEITPNVVWHDDD